MAWRAARAPIMSKVLFGNVASSDRLGRASWPRTFMRPTAARGPGLLTAAALFTDDQRNAAERLVSSLPDWTRIYGVAEQSDRTKALKAAHPFEVNVEVIGRSRAGRPIEAVTVGRGRM